MTERYITLAVFMVFMAAVVAAVGFYFARKERDAGRKHFEQQR